MTTPNTPGGRDLQGALERGLMKDVLNHLWRTFQNCGFSLNEVELDALEKIRALLSAPPPTVSRKAVELIVEHMKGQNLEPCGFDNPVDCVIAILNGAGVPVEEPKP